MSVLIEGMEMPTRCAECRLSTVHSFNDRPLCDVLVEYMSYGEWEAKRLDNCPLIEVPDQHGRLGDLDALPWYLANTSVKYATYEDWEMLCDAIAAAPTVIPASEEAG